MNPFAKIVRKYAKIGFVRNVATLAFGTILAHAITIGAILVTVRLYEPDDFGKLSIYTSILSISLSLATFSVHLAIPIANSDKEACSITILAFCILILGTLVLSMSFAIYLFFLKSEIANESHSTLLFLVVPGFFFGGSYAVLQMWYGRVKDFATLSRTRVARATACAITQITMGFLGFGAIGLILGQLLYHTVGSLRLVVGFTRNEWTAIKDISKSDLLGSLQSTSPYIGFTTIENLTNMAAIQLPLLMIASFGNTEPLGNFHISQMLLMLPMVLLGNSIGQVFAVEAPGHHRNGTLSKFLWKVFFGLLKTGLPIFTLVFVLAPVVAVLLLGEKWRLVGYYIAIVTPWMLLQFVSTPLSTIYYVCARQRLALAIQIISLGIRLGCVAVALYAYPGSVFEIHAGTGVLVYAISLTAILLVARNADEAVRNRDN